MINTNVYLTWIERILNNQYGKKCLLHVFFIVVVKQLCVMSCGFVYNNKVCKEEF